MLDSSLKPLAKYPGAIPPWKSKCTICLQVVYPRFADVKNGIGCAYCSRTRVSVKEAENVMKKAKLNLDEVNYINAHGTSTPMGDEIELGAVQRLFGDNAKKMLMSSTKSSIGHLLGAAGSVEAIYSLLAINNNIAPPTLNLDNGPENLIIDLVVKKAKEHQIDVALSNSFGFGGTNASLIFKRYV